MLWLFAGTRAVAESARRYATNSIIAALFDNNNLNAVGGKKSEIEH